ncbi:MAG: bifunctional phosphopantothenoylcysteine decarboxylase/phosphopantothenate--cysteine ligase CoaBC [Herpetosiphon sp.]
MVDVVMTEEATKFVAPLLFSSLTYRPVFQDMWTTLESAAAHVALGAEADVIVVAPATAQTIARLAYGFADDMLTSVVLASQAPCCVVPAMNVNMYNNAATQANLDILRSRDWTILEPDEGLLASGLVGRGRLPATDRIDGVVRSILGHRFGRLVGTRVLITAGGTHEPLDPVRFLGNRSSGTMGYALAAAARDEGASVTLISGPVSLLPPAGVSVISIETAAEMANAVGQLITTADLLLMAAAVADYRPAERSEHKIKKSHQERTVMLTRTPDILASLSETVRCVKVGFAAETENLLEGAREKLMRKNLDMIVANDAVGSIGSQTAEVTLIDRSGMERTLPEGPKSTIARHIIDTIVERWPQRLRHDHSTEGTPNE